MERFLRLAFDDCTLSHVFLLKDDRARSLFALSLRLADFACRVFTLAPDQPLPRRPDPA